MLMMRGGALSSHSDEAHKATGNHAYVQVIRYLQAYNHLFRILALTATPSGALIRPSFSSHR
jgi:ERCC4-related helicase